MIGYKYNTNMAHTILIIDDEEALRGILKETLERAGYTVFLAEDGEEGGAILGRENVDLVLCDLIMPNKEGLETIMEFRKKYSDLPIIAMSGCERSSAGGYLKLASKLGANDTLPKPFNRADVLGRIQGLLASGQSGEE